MTSYEGFIRSFEKMDNRVDLNYCGCEVPRSKNGWPTVEPDIMDDLQLIYEASRWRSTARDTHPGTVGGHCWTKYTDELIKRGRMDLDCQKRYDIQKILTRDWNDLPVGPIVVHPVVAPPVQFDPSAAPERRWWDSVKTLFGVK